jgi:hypothetical protein
MLVFYVLEIIPLILEATVSMKVFLHMIEGVRVKMQKQCLFIEESLKKREVKYKS